MKKYDIKRQKDTQEKKKKKENDGCSIVKGKSLSVSKCTKNIVELVQFGSIFLCLNFSIIS